MFHLMKQLTAERSGRNLRINSLNIADYSYLALLLSPYRSKTHLMVGTPAFNRLLRTPLIYSHLKFLVQEQERNKKILTSPRTDMQLRCLFNAGIDKSPERIIIDFKKTLKTLGDLDLP